MVSIAALNFSSENEPLITKPPFEISRSSLAPDSSVQMTGVPVAKLSATTNGDPSYQVLEKMSPTYFS